MAGDDVNWGNDLGKQSDSVGGHSGPLGCLSTCASALGTQAGAQCHTQGGQPASFMTNVKKEGKRRTHLPMNG